MSADAKLAVYFLMLVAQITQYMCHTT